MTILNVLLAFLLGFWVWILFKHLQIDSFVRKRGMKVPWQSHAMKVVCCLCIAWNLVLLRSTP